MDVESLICKHKDSVYKQMIRTCHGRREDAEDALAEAILAALQAAEHLRHEEAFRAWLGRVALRVCLRMQAKEALIEKVRLLGLEELPSSEGLVETPEDEAIRAALKRSVHEASSHLPALYRTVYERVELRGRPLQEVALQDGISQEAAKTRLRRARKLVRNRLDRAVWCIPRKKVDPRPPKSPSYVGNGAHSRAD